MQHAGVTAGRNEIPHEEGSSAPDAISNDGRYLTLAAVERHHIEAVLRAYEGNKVSAAESLGISLKTLYNRLNAYKAADARAGRA